MLDIKIHNYFLDDFLEGIKKEVLAGFLFGSIAKGYFKKHHDIDTFLIFNNENKEMFQLARKKYFLFHRKFDTIPDKEYPGEFFSKKQIDSFLSTPICASKWYSYTEYALDQLFVLEVLSGKKIAIFGKQSYINELEYISKQKINEWRNSFNGKILEMSNYKILKHIIYK